MVYKDEWLGTNAFKEVSPGLQSRSTFVKKHRGKQIEGKKLSLLNEVECSVKVDFVQPSLRAFAFTRLRCLC